MVSLSNSKFQSLSIRPPTPPKDIENSSDKDAEEVLDFLHDPFGTKEPVAKVAAAEALLNTPAPSPSSEGEIPSSSARRRKRVNFQAQPCTTRHTGLAPQYFTPLHSSPLRPLPQTRVSKPLKSILKPSDAASTPPPTDEGAPAHKYKSFAEMLESIMKQLAANRRSSSVDAYHSLHRTMQAYDKIPDTQALLDKLGLLTQFIRRDIQAVGINGSGLDSQLIGQALKLLMALVRLPEVKTAMDDDFCNFIVDRIVQVAADETMPKAIVNTHLAMLMQQTFKGKTMTPVRVERILDVLDTIHDRVTGLSVLAYRIRIYRKLIQQRPEVMAKHAERWLRHTFKGLLSLQKDIHQSTLDLILSAARTIGTDRNFSNAVLTILNRARTDGDTYAKVIAKELDGWLESDSFAMVPQIWAAVIALLPGSLIKNRFVSLADWLKLFQKCCNSENISVKMDANVAFGCLVYAVNGKGDEDGLSSWSRMLLKVPQFQLQSKKKAERDSASSAYLTLLYYSFRPLAPHKQYDRCWTEFVEKFWTPLLQGPSPAHALAACRILTVLFTVTNKAWDPQRALDIWDRSMRLRRESKPLETMAREELPALDAKWVRKSLSTILKFVETLLDAAPWSVEEGRDEPVKMMWFSLLQSLKAASAQEVTASSESKDAMAHIVNLLRRVWDTHTAQLALSQETEDSWADKFCFLLETTVERLGSLQFSDKCLTRNGLDEFEAAASTPSNRSRQSGARTSPMLYFVDLLVNQSEGKLSEHVRLRALELLLRPCFDTQNTRLGRLELLRDCASSVGPSTTIVATSFWVQTAGLVKKCLDDDRSPDPNDTSRQLGKEYEAVVDILRLGFPCLVAQPCSLDVLSSFVETVRTEASESAVVLAVVEKVSECILKQSSSEHQTTSLLWLSILLRNLPDKINKRTLDQGRQMLWPSSSAPGRSPDFDPYTYLYNVVISAGSAAYVELNARRADVLREFIAALASSIKTCPISLLAVYLRKVQATIRLWVEDPEQKLQKKDQVSKELHSQIVLLWRDVCTAIERLPRRDSQILLHLEPILTAGFLSRRRAVVNMSITTWNATFGKEETLRYPAKLEQALRRLRGTVELSLPSLEARVEDSTNAPSYYESDDSVDDPAPKPKSPHVKASPFRIVKPSRQSRSPAVSSATRRTPTRRIPRVRLRHDNSQIRFEPILSSPSDPFVQESQILTERQREMVERQMASNLFANIGVTSSPTRPEAPLLVHSPLEIHSDAVDADELPMETVRTPLRNLASLGPMDVFVGSSPTPQARTRTREAASEQPSVATPTATRTLHLDDNDNLGSSPPRFEKAAEANADNLRSNDTSKDDVSDSFAYGQLGESFSFDEETTLDDTILPQAGPAGEDAFAADVTVSDMPSSTIDLQLTAQIDADMQAQVEASPSKQTENITYNTEDAPVASPFAEDQESRRGTQDEDAQVADTQIKTSSRMNQSTPLASTSSTSRVGDSFSSQAADMESPHVRSLRSSQRVSPTPSPSQPSSATKRKSTGRGRGRPKRAKIEEPAVEESEAAPTPMKSAPVSDDILDNIVVASPHTKFVVKRPGRISLGAREGEVVIPETNRKRTMRRSASQLSQVQTQSEDGVVEETPAPKRARRSDSQDVGGAKATTPASQTARLSHVQVTPKRSSKGGSSVRSSSVVADEKASQAAAIELIQDVVAVGEQVADVEVAQQPSTKISVAAGEVQQSQASTSTPNRSFSERVFLTPKSIIKHLLSFKDTLIRSSQLVLGRQDQREIDDALFEIRREVHEAGRRGEEGS